MNRQHREIADKMQDQFAGWAVFLDGIEGMVAQAIERGWSEEQARDIVHATLTRQPDGTEEEQ